MFFSAVNMSVALYALVRATSMRSWWLPLRTLTISLIRLPPYSIVRIHHAYISESRGDIFFPWVTIPRPASYRKLTWPKQRGAGTKRHSIMDLVGLTEGERSDTLLRLQRRWRQGADQRAIGLLEMTSTRRVSLELLRPTWPLTDAEARRRPEYED